MQPPCTLRQCSSSQLHPHKSWISAVWLETICERHGWWTTAISHHPTTELLLVLILQHSYASPPLSVPLPFPTTKHHPSLNTQQGSSSAVTPRSPGIWALHTIFRPILFQMSALSALMPPLRSDSFWVKDSLESAVQLIPQESPNSSKSQNQQADSCACQTCYDSVNVHGRGTVQSFLSAVRIWPLWARDRENLMYLHRVLHATWLPCQRTLEYFSD